MCSVACCKSEEKSKEVFSVEDSGPFFLQLMRCLQYRKPIGYLSLCPVTKSKGCSMKFYSPPRLCIDCSEIHNDYSNPYE